MAIINWLVFGMEVLYVYCVIGIEFCDIYINIMLQIITFDI
jgi:hypothetical protein